MMFDMDELLFKLSSRLPELEWKIGSLNPITFRQSLPKGLFQQRDSELTGAACIAEIKKDIFALTNQKNELSAQYLAKRIQQKINVLVQVCLIKYPEKKKDNVQGIGLETFSTRQQWIQNKEAEIELLTQQRQAILYTLEQLKSNQQQEQILNAQAELGEIERRLTLVKELLA